MDVKSKDYKNCQAVQLCPFRLRVPFEKQLFVLEGNYEGGLYVAVGGDF
jgi:hypothetical protein